MEPAVSLQDVPRVSPAWLRPSAFGLVLCLHLVILVGIPWPAGTSRTEPPPFEIQVISPPEPAQLLVPIDSATAVEVKPANAVPIDVQAVEAQPLHGREVAEIKPPEPTVATGSPQDLPIAPEPEAVEPLTARPPTAPVQVAQPAPAAESPEGSAVPVDPPRQALLPSSEQHVAELEPPVVRPEAAVQATQPARHAPSAEAPAPALDPPSQSLSPEQHVAESEPLQVRPAAPVEVVQPAREPPRAQASAIGPPSRLLSSEQRVAESEALEVRPPTARAAVAQPAPEAPAAAPSALAIDPPSQPLSSEQQVAELAPLAVPQAAAAVPVGPPAHEVARAESSVASNSLTQGTVLSSEKQVAKLEPYSSVAALLQGEGPVVAGRIGKIVHYVEQYDGGRCFFVAPVAVTETEAKLEGYGASARPFEALDSAFRHENGFEASIDVRLVNPAQCPAVTFLGRLRGTNAPHLHIDGVNLGPGQVLTGTVDGFGSRNVELLVATDAGTVQNVSHFLKPGTDAKTFTIGRSDIAWASGGQPQLLIVVASPLPLKALRFDRPVAADRVFPAALGEAERANQPIAAMARYFKLGR
jgi:serine/threonine-protein kinase